MGELGKREKERRQEVKTRATFRRPVTDQAMLTATLGRFCDLGIRGLSTLRIGVVRTLKSASSPYRGTNEKDKIMSSEKLETADQLFDLFSDTERLKTYKFSAPVD